MRASGVSLMTLTTPSAMPADQGRRRAAAMLYAMPAVTKGVVCPNVIDHWNGVESHTTSVTPTNTPMGIGR